MYRTNRFLRSEQLEALKEIEGSLFKSLNGPRDGDGWPPDTAP